MPFLSRNSIEAEKLQMCTNGHGKSNKVNRNQQSKKEESGQLRMANPKGCHLSKEYGIILPSNAGRKHGIILLIKPSPKESPMEVKEAIRTVLRELILPELDRMKEENRETRTILSMINQRLDDVNKRLDDVNLHLTDQSRRIDALREELSHRIGETNNRIDETNNRIDKTNTRIDRLYEVIVRRDEHVMVSDRVAVLEQEVNDLKRRLAT